MLRRLLNRVWGIGSQLNELADELGAPRKWVVCPSCGAQSWRLPPHGIATSCPLVQTVTDSIGLKFDADRNLLIGSRQQMEAVTRFMREQFGEGDESG